MLNKLQKLERQKKKIENRIAHELSERPASVRVKEVLPSIGYDTGFIVTDWMGSAGQFQILMKFNNGVDYTYGLVRGVLEKLLCVANFSHLYADVEGIHLIFYN